MVVDEEESFRPALSSAATAAATAVPASGDDGPIGSSGKISKYVMVPEPYSGIQRKLS